MEFNKKIEAKFRGKTNVTVNFYSPCGCGNYVSRKTESSIDDSNCPPRFGMKRIVIVCENCGCHPPRCKISSELQASAALLSDAMIKAGASARELSCSLIKKD